jgi:hypothetical protein
VRRVYIKELYRYRDVQQYTGRFIAFLTRHLFYLNIPSHVKELCSKQITHRRSLAILLLSHLTSLPVWRKTSWTGNDQSDRENHRFIAIIFPPNLPQLKGIRFGVKNRIITVVLFV